LRAMHLVVTEVTEPFEPENGAYATGGHFGGHHHGHEHDHDHSHDHVHTPPLDPTAPHVHGPGCGHDH
jgi:urease accessory protein